MNQEMGVHRSKKFDLAIIVGAVAIIAGGIGFAVGHATAAKPATSAQASGGFGGGAGGSAGSGSRRFGGSRPVFGTVSAVSGNTITVTETSGTTATVDVTSSTTYTNGDGSAASLSSITSGASIAAFGTTTSGTVSATRVIVNPQTGGGFGGGGAGSSASN